MFVLKCYSGFRAKMLMGELKLIFRNNEQIFTDNQAYKSVSLRKAVEHRARTVFKFYISQYIPSISKDMYTSWKIWSVK